MFDDIIFTAVPTSGESIHIGQDDVDRLAFAGRNAIAADHSVAQRALGNWDGEDASPTPILGFGYLTWNPDLHEVTVDGVLLPVRTAAELVAVGWWLSLQ